MIKYKKLTAALAALAISAGIFSGCGESETAPDWSSLELDVSQAASDIAAATKFDAEMVGLDEDQIVMSYGGDIRSAESLGICAAGGASAEQVIVAKCAEGGNAETSAEIKALFSDLAGQYADYAPAEVPKLENAVIIERGNYVFAVVTSDAEGARNAIDTVCGAGN